MRLSQEAIQRMISGRLGGGGGGGSFDPSALAGYATQAWTEENYISKTFFNELFIVHKKVTTVVMDGETEISRTVTTNSIFAPNEIPGTTTETDEETGYVTTVTTEISSIESKKGFWTNYFISALGLNSEGGGGGLTLNEPLATINVSGLADHPSSSGQTIVWNGSAWVYGTAGGGTGTVTGVKVGDITYSPVNGIVSIPAYPRSLAWSAITGKPTTLSGYGITDAKIENGVITLGSNTITPLTSSDITDMATKTWVGQQGFALASNVYSKTDADAKFMTIAAFENLFNALNSSNQKVSHPYSSGVASIKAMVGLWTEQYLSALGKSDSGGEIVLNEPLASINDAGLAAHPSSSGQTIVWNGSAWTYGTAGGSGMTYTFATGDANGQFKVTPSSGAAYNVSIKGLAALAYKASLAVSDIPDLSGRYLPLTGGNLTGNLGIIFPYDLSKSNNGVSDTLWPGYRIYDKDGRRSAQFVNGVYSSGSNFVWMGVSNYDTSGNMIADYGIGLSVDKNGAGTWSVSQPAAFRTAIDALSKTEINGYTWWGRALSNGVVNGDMTNVGNISFSASGKNIGGLMSFVTAGNGTVGVGTLSPNTNYKMDVNGYTKTARLYLSDTIYMVVQNDGIHIVGGGLYADTYVSALGLSDSGGSTFDESAMWIALGTNISQKQISSTYLTNALAPYALKTDIPSLKSLSWSYGSVTSASGSSYNGSTATSFVIPKNTSHLVNDSGFVTSSALGSYLPLTGGNLTGNLGIIFPHDLSKTDNGVTSTLWPGYRIFDKDGRNSAQWVNGVYPDGRNYIWYSVRQYNTSGTLIAEGGMGLQLSKNGVATWQVSYPSEFRTAIGIPTLLGGYLPLTGGTVTGAVALNGGITPIVSGNVQTHGANGKLLIKNASVSGDSTPNNGIVLEYGNSSSWVGQLYMADNGEDGIYWGGWHNGARSTWKKILDSGNTSITGNNVKINNVSLQVSSSYILPSPGTFTNSGYWHRLGNYVTAGDSQSFYIDIYDGTGYNAQAEQNSIARIVIKDGWQSTQAAANSVGVSVERFGNLFNLKVSIVATAHNAGAVWVFLPWQYASGTYTVGGRYTTWTHNAGTEEDTTTEPVTNQTINSASVHSYLYYDNAYLTSNVASATKLQTTRYIWGNAFDGTADINGNLIMPNSRSIVIKDTNGVEQNVFTYNSGNDVVIGWGPRATSDTYITGNTVCLARNGGSAAVLVNAYNNVGIGTGGDSTYKLTVAGAAKVNELWIGNIRITASAEGIHIANGGLSANTYVSALGVGDQGGGGGADLETVWNSMAENDSSHYIHISHIQSALSSYLSYNNYITSSSITDMATRTWVGQQGYITSSALTGYATQQWVTNQGYVTNAGVMSVGMSVPTGLRVNSAASATITGTGTFALTFTSGYSIPTTANQSNWDTAYGWGNHATAGYSTPQGVATQMQSYAYISGNVIHIGDSSITPLTSHQSVDGTFWGRSWSNHGTVSGSIEAGNSGGYIRGFDHIDLNTHASLYGYGGYIDFYYNGANSYTSRIIEEESGVLSIKAPNVAGLLVGGYNGDYVQIGQIRIVYDYSNNALKVMHSNGGAANLYALGGISALGISSSSSGSVSSSLIPGSSGEYDLGSTSYKWRNLYLYNGGAFSIVPNSSTINFQSNKKISINSDVELVDETNLYVDNRICIGSNNSSYAFYVSGNSYLTGSISASNVINRSDMRIKDFVENTDLSVDAIAEAPSFKFTFKDGDSRLRVGTSAQYWRGALPESVFSDADGMFGLDYGVTALVSVISVARKVMTHEEEIAALKRRIGELENEIETLKAA